MRRYLIVAATSLAALSASAQKLSEVQDVTHTLEGDYATYDGRILLTDGSEAKGTINYNDRTAVVTFKSESKTGTYNARNLVGFDFYDPDSDQQRIFFSMDYEMRDGGQRTSQFFEVVRQYKNFAVIIKTDPVSVKKKIGVVEALGGSYERNRVVASYAMTIYFINDDLGIRPYLEYVTKDVSHFNKLWKWDYFLLDGTRSRLRTLDIRLPEVLMGTDYDKVEKWARKNKLDWDIQEDLLKILDYYDSLVD